MIVWPSKRTGAADGSVEPAGTPLALADADEGAPVAVEAAGWPVQAATNDTMARTWMFRKAERMTARFVDGEFAWVIPAPQL
jgi:hypothetical protein